VIEVKCHLLFSLFC